MEIIAVAIAFQFHIKKSATQIELKTSYPLGIVFSIGAILCLITGLGNYMKTVTKYAENAPIAQSGRKTQAVILMVSVLLVATCILLIVTDAVAKCQ